MSNTCTETRTIEEFANGLPVHPNGVVEGGKEHYDVEVSVGTMVPEIVGFCNQLLEMKQVAVTFDLEHYLNSLLYYRVMQLKGKAPRSMSEVAIPNFFFPVLASLGKYEDPMRALSIIPRMAYTPMTPEEMSSASFSMRATGIAHSLGLPRGLTVDVDDIYRVSEECGELRVAQREVGNATLLVRTAVRIEFLKEVFGASKTRYLPVSSSRATWESIVLATLLSGNR